GQDPGHDRYLQATLVAQVVFALEKVFRVVEELRDQEVGAGLDLGGRPVPVEPLVAALDVAFRIERRPDGERVPALHERHQLHGVGEATGHRRKRRLALGRIAAQRQDVLDAQTPGLVEYRAELFARRADAGEVRHRLDAALLADA